MKGRNKVFKVFTDCSSSSHGVFGLAPSHFPDETEKPERTNKKEETAKEGGVVGLAPRHEFKQKPHMFFYRKVSAQETLLASTVTYAVLDVKIRLAQLRILQRVLVTRFRCRICVGNFLM